MAANKSIWHKPDEIPEKGKNFISHWQHLGVEHYTQYVSKGTKATEDPDEIRWCYTEDLIKLADEKEHKDFLDGVYSFLVNMDDDIASGSVWQYPEYEIVDEPKGKKQKIDLEESNVDKIPEEYAFLTHRYVNQTTNGGYTGDDFSGDLYFPLPDGKYMKVFYQC